MPHSDPANLDNLKDIVAAPPVPLWPPAPGWSVVAGVAALAIVWAAWNTWRRWRAAAYRRAALVELSQAGQIAMDPRQRSHALATVAELLKRTALVAFPRAEVASLSGDAWLAFLDRTGGNGRFSIGTGRLIAEFPYDPLACDRLNPPAIADLLQAVEFWIRTHSTRGVSTNH